ncbi:site-specific integrase [Pseudomonas inefficax]|uniref:site-specific integrase n=2 Tax=Pseudomonas putida group TaxID=136845 RepID=UPI0028BEA6A9|nr:site-specific integrase [Pseudomonas inefficax]WNN41853.1 site-specific integrase [Pseudomonas inefficax]
MFSVTLGRPYLIGSAKSSETLTAQLFEAMKMIKISPTELVTQIECRFGIEADVFPSTVISTFGQAITIHNNDAWVEKITVEIVGCAPMNIAWSKPLHSNLLVEWLLRGWFIDRLQTHIDLRPLIVVQRLLAQHKFSGNDADTIGNRLSTFAVRECTSLKASSWYEDLVALRVFYRWCLDEEVPGFNEHDSLELSQLTVKTFDNRHLVTMRDDDFGPFTRVQLANIEMTLVSNPLVTHVQRTLFLLCRDWALRPIQLALMQITDFGVDEGGPFVKVPSVKGIRRSRLRRHPSNLVKRYIANDTAEAVELQCTLAETQCNAASKDINAICARHGISTPVLPTPLFPSAYKTENRLLRFLTNPKLTPFTLHLDNHRISYALTSLTWILQLPDPHRPIQKTEPFMRITAYRLRRTKATSMVLSGASPEEVAEALDHSNLNSIKHYFHYNLELQEFINTTHMASPEINAAVQMWCGKFMEEIPERSALRPISGLGSCNSEGPCPYHPTVTCYACPKFRPSRHANHEGALADITKFQQMLGSNSTGAMAQQVEAAIHGAKSVIIAVKELED